MAAKVNRRSTASASKTLSARAIKWLSRLMICFSVITIMFRCPSSQALVTPDSPILCTPYLSLASHLKPHLQHYYDIYAPLQVKALQSRTDDIYRHIYLPVSALASESYYEYASPTIRYAAIIVEQQYNRTIKPKLDQVRKEAHTRYGPWLESYVAKVTQVLSPILHDTRIFAVHHYHETLIPFYHFSRPYMLSAYSHGRQYIIDVGFPQALWLSNIVVAFLRTKAWPCVQMIFIRNVQPRLANIGQGLSNYLISPELEATVLEKSKDPAGYDSSDIVLGFVESINIDNLESNSGEGTLTLSPQQAALLPASTPPSSEITPPSPVNSLAANTKENLKLVDFLEHWEAKVENISNSGIEYLSSYFAKLAAKQVQRAVNTTVLAELDKECIKQTTGLESNIIKLVDTTLAKTFDEEQLDAHSSVLSTLRSAGGAIKVKAEELLSWKRDYDHEINDPVKNITNYVVDLINEICDAAMKETRNRWPSADRTSDKNWQAYVSMRKTCDYSIARVSAVAKNQKNIVEARKLGKELEEQAMHIARLAAAEIKRVHLVAKNKINDRKAGNDGRHTSELVVYKVD